MTNENFDIERELTIARLIDKHLRESLSDEERLDLNSWLNQSPENKALFERFILSNTSGRISPLDKYDTAIAISAINRKIDRIKRKRIIKRWAAAAALIPILLVGAFLIKNNDKQTQQPGSTSTIVSADDLLPGSGTVVIRKEDGTNFYIRNNSDTSFLVGKTHLKEQQGILSLLSNEKESVEYHTLETHRGANHKIVLSDGSAVWLNASSSIRFPSRFEGADRRVQISGEAFFEVQHNPKMPFIVETDSIAIKVLGTKFNVNTNNKEKITTTLVSGSVKLIHSGSNRILSPGQSGTLNKNEIEISLADLEQVTGWKNGAFVKHHSDLVTIMTEISEWYNVDIIYEPGFVNTPNMNFDVNKKIPLGKLLQLIDLSTSNKIGYREGKVFVSKM